MWLSQLAELHASQEESWNHGMVTPPELQASQGTTQSGKATWHPDLPIYQILLKKKSKVLSDYLSKASPACHSTLSK
jgi:hypothetical protein